MDKIFVGDSLKILRTLPNESVQTCVTSPPYFGLRNYGMSKQIGLEETPEDYVVKLVAIFREVRRVLKDDGTLWLNLGDSYAGSGRGMDGDGRPGKSGIKQRTNMGSNIDFHDKRVAARVIGRKWVQPPPGLKPKDLMGIPWRVAFALQSDGWYLRSDIIWHKPNPMPESVTDRPTKAHEYLFLLSKSPTYYYDHGAIKEPAGTVGHARHLRADKTAALRFRRSGRQANGKPQENSRNRRSVWTVAIKPFKGAHFATFPLDLIEPCILAGIPIGGVVLDPFLGSGTTALAARKGGRHYIGIELNPAYVSIARNRIGAAGLPPDG